MLPICALIRYRRLELAFAESELEENLMDIVLPLDVNGPGSSFPHRSLPRTIEFKEPGPS